MEMNVTETKTLTLGTVRVGAALRAGFASLLNEAELHGADVSYAQHSSLFTTTYLNLKVTGPVAVVDKVSQTVDAYFAAYGYEL